MRLLSNSVKLIKLSNGQYPVSMSQFKAMTPGYAWGETIPESVVVIHGFAVVEESPQPQGDVVIEGQPEKQGETWYQKWLARDFTPEETQSRLSSMKTTALSLLDGILNELLEIGASYEFSSGHQHIQLREKDKTNLTGLALTAVRSPEKTFYFRTYENQLNELTAAQMLAVSDRAFEAFTQAMGTYWYFQGVINSATTDEQIPSETVIRQTLENTFE